LSITFLETVDVRVKTGEDDSDISLSITFLETVDVRASSAGTGDSSRDISYDSGSRGDDGGEIQKTRSPMYKMYTRDKHDYDDFQLSVSSNKSSVVRYLELV
jgi:hypothetical protein